MATPNEIHDFKVISNIYLPKHSFQPSLVKCVNTSTGSRVCTYESEKIKISQHVMRSSWERWGNDHQEIYLDVFDGDKVVLQEQRLRDASSN